MDPGLEAYKKGRYILLAFKEGCWWYNFTDDWNAPLYQKQQLNFCVNIHVCKVENKMPFQGTFLYNCIEHAMLSLHVQLV